MLALLSLSLLARSSRAEEDEARWSARPIAGVALTTEEQADPALAFAQGASVSLAYGVTDRLDLGAEIVGLRAEPSFDASIPVEDVIIRGPFLRRISSAALLLGPTWRFGRPGGWTPVLAASAGGGLRYRSLGKFAEYRYMRPARTPRAAGTPSPPAELGSSGGSIAAGPSGPMHRWRRPGGRTCASSRRLPCRLDFPTRTILDGDRINEQHAGDARPGVHDVNPDGEKRSVGHHR
ncbi:MAG: hypothetical protein HC863_00510 [Myxococcales bacterium]|nr:hypothetical protein [Myxococcales bacterium]